MYLSNMALKSSLPRVRIDQPDEPGTFPKGWHRPSKYRLSGPFSSPESGEINGEQSRACVFVYAVSHREVVIEARVGSDAVER